MSSNSAMPASAAQSLRILILALSGAIIVVTVVVMFAIPIEDTEPDPVFVGAALGIVLIAALVARIFGFAAQALPADARRDPGHGVLPEAYAQFQTSTILRFALTEAGFIIVVALTFVVDNGPWPLLISALPAAAAVYVNCWPSRGNVDRIATQLEANGAQTNLRELFGHS